MGNNTELASIRPANEPPYQNQKERQIGRLLDSYGLPFFYRQPTLVYHDHKNEIWRPSFTLNQDGGAVIDYLDSPNPAVLEQRIEIYRYNQIPATVLGPRSLEQPNWQQDLYLKLRQSLRKPDYSLDHYLQS